MMMFMLFKLSGDLLWCVMGGKQFHWYKVETIVCPLLPCPLPNVTRKQKTTVIRYCPVHRARSAHEARDTWLHDS